MTKEKANALTLCNKEGYRRKSITRWTCVPPLKGRKGQGKGRISSLRGVGKSGAPCKHGVSKKSGKCRTPKQGRRHKKSKADRALRKSVGLNF